MSERPDGVNQPLLGYMSNDEWDALLADVNQRVEQMEALPEGAMRQQVFDLLNGIDTLHREGLRRLVRLFKDGVLEQVVTDPAIHTLMELYDLLPNEQVQATVVTGAAGATAPTAATAAAVSTTAAAALAATPTRLSAPKSAFPVIPIRAVRAAPAPLRYPHWVPVLARLDELASGAMRDDIVIDGLALLLARRGEQWFALDAACPVDGASLRGARLNGYTLSCPHHGGCHYDIRSGARIGGGPGLTPRPVKADEQGRVLVGLDMEFKPALPSF